MICVDIWWKSINQQVQRPVGCVVTAVQHPVMALIKRDFPRNAPQKSSEAALAEMNGWMGEGRTGCPWMGTWEGGAGVGVARKG